MAVKPIPDGYYSVTPYLYIRGAARAIEFYKKAFGAKELLRMPDPSGKVGHAEIKIGTMQMRMADEFSMVGRVGSATASGTTSSLLLYVDDADATFQQAVAAGATVAKPLQDQFYGDRSGTVTDPFGHQWTIATHKEDVSMEEMQRRMAAMK